MDTSISDIPPEVLSTILGHLIEADPRTPPKRKLAHVCSARLVCQHWSTLCTPHLFETLSLTNTREDFSPWNGLLDSEAIRRTARRVVVQSCHSYGPSAKATEGIYPAFTDAIARIAELPGISALKIVFYRQCLGVESADFLSYGLVESPAARVNVLKAVFGGIRRRAAEDPGAARIQSLTLENLQNMPIPEFTGSELYRDVMRDVDTLHLLVAEEYNEEEPNHEINCIERQQYEPHLQSTLLPPIADQLTTLTLAFLEPWGVLPGYFNGRGLVFPRLKTLTLGEFVIGYHDHMDWVLAQTSLTTLRLDRCFVVSHLSVGDEKLHEWDVRTDDWELHPRGAYGTLDSESVYTFPGTWAAILDRIRTRLVNLTDFRLENDESELKFWMPQVMGARLSSLRYVNFADENQYAPWLQASVDGDMEFGNNIARPEPGDQDSVGEVSLNRARDTEGADGAALDALLLAVEERRRAI